MRTRMYRFIACFIILICSYSYPVAAQGDGEIEFSSVAKVAEHIRRAADITISAYVLSPRGSVGQALRIAADRGARVHIVLDGVAMGSIRAANIRAAELYRNHRMRVDITSYPLHAKAAIIDGTIYVSDRNWATRAKSEIVLIDRSERDKPLVLRAMLGQTGTNDHFTTRKRDALRLESQVIAEGTTREIQVETEAYTPGTVVEHALLERARSGTHIRLIVDEREYSRSSRERFALQALARQGIEVRTGHTSEKIAIAGDRAWIGSANMTPGVPEQVDWGMQIFGAHISRISTGFERNWNRALTIALQNR